MLLFVWPETEEPVRLLAGPKTLQRPSYDLSALGETLLSHPWQPAEINLRGESAMTESEGLDQWIDAIISLD